MLLHSLGMSVRGFALTTAKGFLHHPLRDSLLEMTPHEFLHVVKVTPPPPPSPRPAPPDCCGN